MMVPRGAGAARMRSIVTRLIPVSWCTRCLLIPAPTAHRTRLSRSRVTKAHSVSMASASSGVMFTTVHVLHCTINGMTSVSAADASMGGVRFPAVVWPPRLLRPPRPPALIYLDLNHFINLARTIAGEAVPNGYDALLRAVRRACSEDRAVFPLSARAQARAQKKKYQKSTAAHAMAISRMTPA